MCDLTHMQSPRDLSGRCCIEVGRLGNQHLQSKLCKLRSDTWIVMAEKDGQVAFLCAEFPMRIEIRFDSRKQLRDSIGSDFTLRCGVPCVRGSKRLHDPFDGGDRVEKGN